MGLLRRGSVSVEIGKLGVQLEGNHAAYPYIFRRWTPPVIRSVPSLEKRTINVHGPCRHTYIPTYLLKIYIQDSAYNPSDIHQWFLIAQTMIGSLSSIVSHEARPGADPVPWSVTFLVALWRWE